MSFASRGTLIGLFVGAAVAITATTQPPVWAEDAPPPKSEENEPEASAQPWRIVLEQQLRREKNCDFSELLYFNEMEIGGGTALEGRVTCIDGRMFDFSRPQVHQKFDIRLCEPAVC